MVKAFASRGASQGSYKGNTGRRVSLHGGVEWQCHAVAAFLWFLCNARPTEREIVSLSCLCYCWVRVLRVLRVVRVVRVFASWGFRIYVVYASFAFLFVHIGCGVSCRCSHYKVATHA